MLALGAVGTAAAAAPSPSPVRPLTAAEREARISTYKSAHPDDIVGLDLFQQSMGARPTWHLLPGMTQAVSSTEAASIIASRKGSVGPLAVPTDSFSVGISGTYYPSWPDWRIAGSWNFRDNYVNGSDPDDVSNNAADPARCFNETEITFFYIYDYTNVQRSNWSLYDAGLTQPNTTVKINDGVSAFVTNFDHGEHVTYYEKSNASCSGSRIRAVYKYEHNQDFSSNSIGISIGWGLLNLSYSGSGGSTLQKSSGIFDSTG